MIQINTNSAKRASICGIDYVLNSEATVKDHLGNKIRVLVTEWIPIKFSSASFLEKDETNGELVSQELSIKLAGIDQETEQLIRDVAGSGILIRLLYTSGVYKVVGTEENPVLLAHSSSESPTFHTLYSNRNSAEKAKFLLS
jgi:hypothetical protein